MRYMNSRLSFILASLMAVCQFQCKQSEKSNVTPLKGQLELVTAEESTPYPEAGISGVEYKQGQFTFQITGGFQLGEQTPDAAQKTCANSNQGQHIHLIVDNNPYEAKYTAEFRHIIPEGDHYLLAFLSRSYHESIKTTKASILVHTSIQDSSFKKIEPVTMPMLFYSRPKGTYIGVDAQNLLLDFYLANCTLGDTYKVKAEITDTAFMIDQWKPYILKGLPMGEHTLTLSLVDSTGQLVQTPLNPVQRKFILQAEPGK